MKKKHEKLKAREMQYDNGEETRTNIPLGPPYPQIRGTNKEAGKDGDVELKVIFHQTQIWDAARKTSRLDFLSFSPHAPWVSSTFPLISISMLDDALRRVQQR